ESGKPGSCGTPTPPTSSAIDPETKMLGVVGRAIAVLCAALVFAACASAPVAAPSASARGTIALSLAYASVSATQAGAWVAKEQGIFERNGLDVKLESIAGGSSPTAALLSDQVAAGALSMPTYSQAKKLGMKTLVNVADLGFRYPSSWLAVRKSFIERDREAVTRLVRSITEAIAYELAHPTETQAVIGKYAQI